ncbi:MAG TPA: glycosyltransferase [Terriglobales bacterium]|nr:glycosyltransferase [Terriglobales bacterium]
MLAERARLRQARDFAGADAIRDRLRDGGWEVVDSREGSRLHEVEPPPPPRAVTMLTLVHGWPADAERWLDGVLTHTAAHDFEALLADNSGDPDVGARLAARRGDRVRVLTVAPPEGWADAANRALEAATGHTVVLFDPGVELFGDVAGPLLEALDRQGVVVAGAFGVRAEGRVGHFHANDGPVVDAVEGYVLAFRRAAALDAGGFDRKFRFYRLADFELCFKLRDRLGGDAVVVPGLPVERHEHRLWEALDEEERERRSRRNYYRLLDLWGKREDLITK